MPHVELRDTYSGEFTCEVVYLCFMIQSNNEHAGLVADGPFALVSNQADEKGESYGYCSVLHQNVDVCRACNCNCR